MACAECKGLTDVLVHAGVGFTRPPVHISTLKELAAASPQKHTLEQQLAGLQRDLKAKQAEVDAGRADLEHRQQLLRFAAGLQQC